MAAWAASSSAVSAECGKESGIALATVVRQLVAGQLQFRLSRVGAFPIKDVFSSTSNQVLQQLPHAEGKSP